MEGCKCFVRHLNVRGGSSSGCFVMARRISAVALHGVNMLILFFNLEISEPVFSEGSLKGRKVQLNKAVTGEAVQHCSLLWGLQ